MLTLLSVILLGLCAVIRLYCILPRDGRVALVSPRRKHCSIAIFLGSGRPLFSTKTAIDFTVKIVYIGGHTSEALKLVSSLDFDRYFPRTYIVSDGDTLSANKARSLELAKTIKASGVRGAVRSDVPTSDDFLTIPYHVVVLCRWDRLNTRSSPSHARVECINLSSPLLQLRSLLS
jgi:hypothetical protein